ncbi:hypothetical protein GCM10008023_21290 [Sphingomonas glacialis]|uniref:Uncharacterized protein n=1 Tax=Sphingomonas glacialis TaxID=658225 RepID=A0ABQ3LLS6_9SPHN|nr:hypothetical protein GCM10008023_21290 [Sphingomonas glacialis]
MTKHKLIDKAFRRLTSARMAVDDSRLRLRSKAANIIVRVERMTLPVRDADLPRPSIRRARS